MNFYQPISYLNTKKGLPALELVHECSAHVL